MVTIASASATAPLQSSGARPSGNTTPAAPPDEIYVDEPLADEADGIDDGTYGAFASADAQPSDIAGAADDEVYEDEPLADEWASSMPPDDPAWWNEMNASAEPLEPEIYEDEPLWDAGMWDEEVWSYDEPALDTAPLEPEVYVDEPLEGWEETGDSDAPAAAPINSAPAARLDSAETKASARLQSLLEDLSITVDLELSEDRQRDSALDALGARAPVDIVAGAALATGSLLLVGAERAETKPTATTISQVEQAYSEY